VRPLSSTRPDEIVGRHRRDCLLEGSVATRATIAGEGLSVGFADVREDALFDIGRGRGRQRCVAQFQRVGAQSDKGGTPPKDWNRLVAATTARHPRGPVDAVE